MNQRTFLIKFLKRLEHVIPPPNKCHHSITYAKYGSDLDGWTDELALQLNIDGKFVCVFLDEADFDYTIDELIASIGNSINDKNFKPQLGVGPGQYIKG
jgi:hypothetical protein